MLVAMAPTDPSELVHRFVTGDPTAAAELAVEARTSTDTALLVAAALAAPDGDALLERAGQVARTADDRRLVAVAVEFLHGVADRARLLARDHLVDRPDSALAAYVAASPTTASEKRTP
jgi:hypothetical protein